MTTESMLRAARGVALALSLCATAGCVSTPPPPRWKPLDPAVFASPLTLEECLRLARTNDLRAVEWEARLGTARAGIAAARVLPNPTVGLEWEGIGLRDAEGTRLLESKAAVSYPVLFWWPRAYKVAAAQAGRDAEVAAVRVEARRLTVDVGVGWLGLAAGQRRVRTSGELLINAQEALRLAQRGRDLGMRSAYDVARAEAEVLQAEGEVAGEEGKLRVDQLAFAFALGVARPAYPRVVEAEAAKAEGAAAPGGAGGGSAPSPGGAEAVPEELLGLALAADPEWSRAQALLAAAEAELHVQQIARLPLADVLLGGGTKKTPDGRSATASAEAPLPLFDFNAAGVSRAQSELLAARAAEERARRAVVAAVAEDWERVRAAGRREREFARPLVEKLQHLAADARRLFEAGQIPYADLLQARRDLKAAERAAVDAWEEAAAARWTLESALGRHDPAPPAAAPGS